MLDYKVKFVFSYDTKSTPFLPVKHVETMCSKTDGAWVFRMEDASQGYRRDNMIWYILNDIKYHLFVKLSTQWISHCKISKRMS